MKAAYFAIDWSTSSSLAAHSTIASAHLQNSKKKTCVIDFVCEWTVNKSKISSNATSACRTKKKKRLVSGCFLHNKFSKNLMMLRFARYHHSLLTRACFSWMTKIICVDFRVVNTQLLARRTLVGENLHSVNFVWWFQVLLKMISEIS